MTKPKFEKGDRVLYVGAMMKREAKVLMVNGGRPTYEGEPFYDIEIAGETYTVHQYFLRPLMSDAKVSRLIAHNYAQAQHHLDEAKKALTEARKCLEEDGQPQYELTMADEFVIIVKNTLRYELPNQIHHWDEVTDYRKKGN